MPNINLISSSGKFVSMGLTGRKFTLDPSKDHDPLKLAPALDIFSQATELTESWVTLDNEKDRSWGKDLDPRWGSVVRTLESGGHKVGGSVQYDPDDNDRLKSFLLTEEHGHCERKYYFDDDGNVSSVFAKQVLESGKVETLTVRQNEDGTLTYEEKIERK